MVYSTLKKCRLCNCKKFDLVIKLNPTPPANNLTNKKLDLSKITPLEVVKCKKCDHVQLFHLVKEDILFKNYTYRTGLSNQFLEHFKNFTNKYKKILFKKSILEIGSNDASLLNYIATETDKCFGIEPSKNFNKFYNKKISLINGFFNTSNAKKLYKMNNGCFDVIIANNVFAHIIDMQKFSENVSKIMHKNSIFIFEVSYLADVIKNKYFDTIYHEHMSYHSIIPLIRFFKKYNLNIIDVENIKSHGGSIRVFVSKENNQSNRLKKNLKIEKDLKLNKISTFKNFEKSIRNNKDNLIKIIKKSQNQGYEICGFTAPAKATSLIHFYELNNFIKFVYDDNDLKQNKYIPGTDIVVMKPKKLKSNLQMIPIIFAWNIKEQIINKCIEFGFKKIILPLPKAKVIKLK